MYQREERSGVVGRLASEPDRLFCSLVYRERSGVFGVQPMSTIFCFVSNGFGIATLCVLLLFTQDEVAAGGFLRGDSAQDGNVDVNDVADNSWSKTGLSVW